MEDSELFDEVRDLLSRWRTASLATVDALGQPHTANVQFVADERMRLYFVSSPNAAHSQHIALAPRVAMTVYAHIDDAAGPGEIHGLQLHGECFAIVDETERAQAWDRYVKRFTFITQNERLAARVKAEQFYVVHPMWLRWIDNRRGFGFKEERTMMV
ncbi:MAG: pyridoxamine 5'-phosphate oxidase family protein [Phycisphaeraceae bacterium]